MPRIASWVIAALFFINIGGGMFLTFDRTNSTPPSDNVSSDLSSERTATKSDGAFMLMQSMQSRIDAANNRLAKTQRAMIVSHMILVVNMLGLFYLMGYTTFRKNKTATDDSNAKTA